MRTLSILFGAWVGVMALLVNADDTSASIAGIAAACGLHEMLKHRRSA